MFWLRRRLLFVIFLLVILNVTLLVIVWMGRPEAPAPPAGGKAPEQEQARMERLLKEELGFDRAQIEQYLTVRREHQAQVDTLNREIGELKREMFEEVLSDQPEPRLSDSLLALTQTKQAMIERLTFQHFVALKKLCTPDQREKLDILVHELLRRKPPGDERKPSLPPADERKPSPTPGDEGKPPRLRGDERKPPPPPGDERKPPRPPGDERKPPPPLEDEPAPPPQGE